MIVVVGNADEIKTGVTLVMVSSYSLTNKTRFSSPALCPPSWISHSSAKKKKKTNGDGRSILKVSKKQSIRRNPDKDDMVTEEE